MPDKIPNINLGGNSQNSGLENGSSLDQVAGVATSTLDKAVDAVAGDKTPTIKEGEKVVSNNDELSSESNESTEQPKVGDKIAPGMKVNEKGEAEKTATNKVLGTVSRGAAAYFSGGNSKADKAVDSLANSRTFARISDAAEKNIAIKKASEALDDAGLTDAAEGALDALQAVQEMDIKKGTEALKKVVKGKNKTQKFIFKYMLIIIIPFMLIFIPILIVIIGSSSGNGNMFVTDNWDSSVGENRVEGEEEIDSEEDEVDVNIDVEISNDEKESLSYTSRKDRFKYLFPNGVPTSEKAVAPYLTTIQVKVRDSSGNISTINLTVHKKLVANYKGAFDDILNKTNFPIYSAGVYNWRSNTSNRNVNSDHSYGAAIDINPTENPYCKPATCKQLNSVYKIPPSVVSIFKAHGFDWGGDWKTLKDYMHFSYTKG